MTDPVTYVGSAMKSIVAVGALLLLLSSSPVSGTNDPPRLTDYEAYLAYAQEYSEGRTHVINLINRSAVATSADERSGTNLEIETSIVALIAEYADKEVRDCFLLAHTVVQMEYEALAEWRAALRRNDAGEAQKQLLIASSAFSVMGNIAFININDCSAPGGFDSLEVPTGPDLNTAKLVDSVGQTK